MKKNQEWDFPPERRTSFRMSVEGNPFAGSKPTRATRFANSYFRFVVLVLKVVVAIALGLVLLGCLWAMETLLTLPH